MARFSITRRLIVSVILTQAVLTVAVVSLATFLSRRQLRKSFDAELRGRAVSIAALVRFSEDATPRLIFDASLVPPPLDHAHPDFYRVFAADGHIIASAPEWPADFAATAGQPNADVRYHGLRYRMVRLNTPVLDQEGPDTTTSATITVLYASSTERLREELWTMAGLTCLGSLLLLGIATFVTVWAVRGGLSPLAQLAASAGQVTSQDWKLNAPPGARATMELAPLTAAMDDMLASLEQAFSAQREFLANAAHELKTPIAILKSTLQLLLQQPRTAEEYRAQVENALDDLARLETLTHSMLRLARAEQAHSAKRTQDLPLVDIAASCEQSAERLHPLADSRSVEIQVRAQDTPHIPADPEDLELIWNNLLENAIRYSPQGSSVSVSISSEKQFTRVEVRDHGPGIEAGELQSIFNRFHRADTSRSRETGGYGLGLAIVKAMVESYGGAIQAESRVGTGTTMSVRLPLSS